MMVYFFYDIASFEQTLAPDEQIHQAKSKALRVDIYKASQQRITDMSHLYLKPSLQ
jgi:hypothetical protein